MSPDQAAGVPRRDSAGIVFAGIGDEAGAGLHDQIAAMTRLGWRSIELRTVDGVPIAELDDDAFTRVADTLTSAGLTTACVDSRIAGWSRPVTGSFEDDLAELAELAPRCAALGTRYVRIMSYPNDGLDEAAWRRAALDRVRVLAEHAERAGLVLLHENCSGWAARSAERMLTMLEEVASPSLRLLFDIGNGVPYDYPAYDVLAEVVRHVEHVHVKDADGDASAPVYTLPGEGRARVADCLHLLFANHYAGAVSIEPHLLVRPHEGLTDPGAAGVARFVEYGRALERLVREEVVPRLEPAGPRAVSSGGPP
jgi:sugar phosphate isomerase/epimerase